ncbi:PGC-1 and ERR-induced regulator in muscle protein 1 [Hemicordylus capensis]|uniref:PGC-1 and ERR-induced regulator in muscle protein 1 n=1 Tax=Hemicordylus capensis TaxID=884348 RepID=UPI0023043811|nr:PGC-1 and ERR-induced regulator in muscle protein 1 [Hemicordylus capensis]
MENFEYSIQLNDRDWAEFCLASEECSLIQPILATADEQLLSNLEEGEAEDRKSVRVRVGPALAHRAPGRHLVAGEVLSGSEDETEMGSVSRFLCSHSQLGTAFPPSSGTQEGQMSHVALKPPGSQSRSARGHEALFAGKEKESEIGGRRMNPDSSTSVVSTAVQEDNVPGQEISEKLTCAGQTNVDTSEGMESPAEENRSGPLCLELQQPQDKVVSRATSVDFQFPTSVDCLAAHENPEALESEDLAACFPSPEPEGAEHPKKSTRPLQVNVMARVTPFQEQPSIFQGHPVPVVRVLTPVVPLSGSYGEGTLEKESHGEHDVAHLEEEGRADPNEDLSHDILKAEGQRAQVMSSAIGGGVNLQQFPGGLEKCPRPTLAVDSRCDRVLDKHRGTAPFLGGAEKGDVGEPCHHLGMAAAPSEEESHGPPPGNQGPDFLAESVPCCLAQEDSPESNLTALTSPEMYDYFSYGDTQQQGGKMREGMVEERQGPNTDPGVPEMYGPEMYEYFFNEMGEDWARKDSMDKGIELEVVSTAEQRSIPPGGSEHPDSDTVDSAMAISVPEVYEHFFTNGVKGKRNWRRILLSVPASEARKVARALKSLVCKPARLLQSRPTSQGALLRRGSQGRLVSLSPVLLRESQPRPGDPGIAVMVPPERPLQLVLTHRDMCLGFVALASWAVKTSDLQAPDAWKIVLLANVGTLSAIRYSRRQAVEDRKQGT